MILPRFEALEGRVGALETRFAALETRVGGIERSVDDLARSHYRREECQWPRERLGGHRALEPSNRNHALEHPCAFRARPEGRVRRNLATNSACVYNPHIPRGILAMTARTASTELLALLHEALPGIRDLVNHECPEPYVAERDRCVLAPARRLLGERQTSRLSKSCKTGWCGEPKQSTTGSPRHHCRVVRPRVRTDGQASARH